jgi:hypothetical protein
MKATGLLVLGALLAAAPAVGETAKPAMDEHSGRVAMAGSYLGMADFCTTYGVDYRNLAHTTLDRFRAKPFWRQDDKARAKAMAAVFEDSIVAGTHGQLYSVQAAKFITMSELGRDMMKICTAAHEQAKLISGLQET